GDQYSIDHSASMAVLDPRGRMAGVVTGSAVDDPAAIAADFIALGRGAPQGTGSPRCPGRCRTGCCPRLRARWPTRTRRACAAGLFATVCLSPRDYHRVHMPWSGRLLDAVHVPGRLFSVGPDAVASVPRLFARNERLVCHFETDFGPMAVVMVGALLVSGVETVWSGEEIPAYGDRITSKHWTGENIVLERF